MRSRPLPASRPFLRGRLAPSRPEQVLVETCPHWRSLVRPGLITLVGALLAGVVTGVAETQLPDLVSAPVPLGAIAVVVGLVYALVVLFAAVGPYLRWRGQTLTLTDQRIVGRSGVFRRTGFDMPLSRVSAVRYRHTISDRVFGTGTLIVEAGNGDEYEFSNVPQIAAVHEIMYHHVATAQRFRP